MDINQKSELGTEVERFRSAFSVFDLNGDGKIEKSELIAVMHLLGLSVTDEQVQDLIGRVDQNEDSTIDFAEFLPLFARLLSRALNTTSDLLLSKNIQEDRMTNVRKFLKDNRTPKNPEKEIKVVALIVVVAEEIQPVLDHYNPVPDKALQEEFMNLAYVFKCHVGEAENGYDLFILQVARSPLYNRHYSGYTQSAAISSLASKVLKPDLVISFGTAGGNVSKVSVGDAVVAEGCLFVDRVRTSSKKSFDWGVFGGPTMQTPNMVKDLSLKEGILGSQISYSVNDMQSSLINVIGISGLDMEAASEAEILYQTGTNFLALKMISNGIYPGNPSKMEEEYVEHKAEVSEKGMKALSAVLQYLVGKKLGDL